jgi:hypothetical protein
LHYRNLGHEWFIRDIVPMSEFGHWVIHWWIFDRPLRAVANAYLRIMVVLWAVLFRPFVAIGVILCVWWLWISFSADLLHLWNVISDAWSQAWSFISSFVE